MPCVKRKKNTRQDTRLLSGPKPTMLASSVQSAVACNVTAPRGCTSVLLNLIICCHLLYSFVHNG